MSTQNVLQGKKIFVAGHGGMVGQALVRALSKVDCHLLTATRSELDLQDQSAVRSWFEDKKPEVVFLAAAKVGGILANSLYPADFIHDNLLIQQNVIGSAHQSKVERLVFLGSSCIYPRLSSQPIREDSLLSGPLEETNQWYAIAKIAGLKLVEAFRRQYGVDYISIMPTNLYGPGDTYDAENSHVIPALILKFHEAKINMTPCVSLWGTGTPMREFLYVDDLADACLFLANNYSDMDPINVGTGQDISIKDLSEIVARVVGYDGAITFDGAQLDGTPRKLLDTTKLSNYGWTAKIPLEAGLELTYQNFLTRYSS
ncbi:MAG: GDP-L-fucose synthase [Alphaproteobacteria bacterium]|nr:GDP-L-fucose synthase [Alphaproteobacteria bacterium]